MTRKRGKGKQKCGIINQKLFEDEIKSKIYYRVQLMGVCEI